VITDIIRDLYSYYLATLPKKVGVARRPSGEGVSPGAPPPAGGRLTWKRGRRSSPPFLSILKKEIKRSEQRSRMQL